MADEADRTGGHSLKYARIERERRFLLARVPDDVVATPARLIEDVYIDGTRLRLRRITASDGAREWKLAQKLALDSGRTIITNIYLSRAEFERLAVLPGRRLVKERRHCVAVGCRFGVDAFRAPLDGLVLAEAEVATDEQLHALPVPPFAHCEVTDCIELSGAALARNDPAVSLAFARRLLAGPRATATPL